MAGTLTTSIIQFGDDITQTNDFTLTNDGSGNLVLTVGIIGTSLSSLLTLTNGGVITFATGTTTTFNGAVHAATQSAGNNTTLLATTAFVTAAIATDVTTITGTVNEITASASYGPVTLSIPSTFIAPGTIQGTTLTLTDVTPTVTTGQVGFGTTTSTTATAGSLSSLPLVPAIYLEVNIGGTMYKIPAYNL